MNLFGKKVAPEKPAPVVCAACGCLVAPERAVYVRQSIFLCSPGDDLPYCQKCKPAYDIIVVNCRTGVTEFYNVVPASYLRVNADGTPFYKG